MGKKYLAELDYFCCKIASWHSTSVAKGPFKDYGTELNFKKR